MNATSCLRIFPILLGLVSFSIVASASLSAKAEDLRLDRLIDSAPANGSTALPGSIPLPSQQALRAFPAGDQIGTLFAKAKIVKGDERGDWVKVTVEGWIPKKVLEESPPPVANEVPQGAITVTDFSVERIGKRIVGGDKDVIKLILRVKNSSESVVNSWEGFLQAHLSTGHQLFTIPISSENKPIPAGGSVELSFVWKDGEARFSDLDGRTKSDMTLAISGVQIHR